MNIKIKWVSETRDSPVYGRMELNREYTVDSTFGNQVIGQKFAVKIDEKKKEVKKADKPKGGK